MSIRLKAIMSFFLVAIGIAFGASGFSYLLLQDSLKNEIRGRLRNIAHIGAASMDTAAIERLVARLGEADNPERVAQIEQSADYGRVDRQFQAIRDAEPTLIQYVYILTPTRQPNQARFLVDADVLANVAKLAAGKQVGEEISHFGLNYDIGDKVFIRQAFASAKLVVENDFVPDPQYNTRSMSAYAPVLDSKGQLLGILGVDLKDENMRAAMRQSVTASAFIVLAAIVVALLASVIFGDQLTRGIRALNNVVIEFAGKKFDIRAPVTSRDEIGSLSASFNAMAKTIDDDTKHRQALLAAYGKFVPHSFLSFLRKESIIDLTLGDHVQQEMTVLFSDIRSFTTLSEAMTPKENFDFINAFLRRVGPVIRERGGVIDKYIGDAVMALFPGSPEHAIQAGIDMQKRVAEYNEERLLAGRQPIAIGVGLHTGLLILGTVGEAERMNSTVISDAVNLASRLEGVTKNYGASIVVSAAMLEQLPRESGFHIRFLDKIQVKGKRDAVTIFEVFDADPAPAFRFKQQTADAWNHAIALYFERHFEAAAQAFAELLAIAPDDKPAMLYAERAARSAREGVPADWNGVEVLDAK